MTAQHTHDHDEGRLFELLSALCDGRLEADAHAELERRLTDDRRARLLYRRYVNLHAAMRRACGGRADDVQTAGVINVDRDEAAAPRASARRPWALAAAAVVAIAGLAVALYTAEPTPRPDAPETPAPLVHASVATLTYGDGLVSQDDRTLAPGDTIGSQRLRSAAGEAELLLTSGAQVNLAGPADVRLHGPMHLAVNAGRALFTCPPGADGFTVELPGGVKVVDRGTRFAVYVPVDGPAELYVVEGVVEAIRNGERRTITAGGGARFIADRIDATPAGQGRAPELTEGMRWLLDDLGLDARGVDVGLIAAERFDGPAPTARGWAGPWTTLAGAIRFAGGEARVAGPFEHTSAQRPLAQSLTEPRTPIYFAADVVTSHAERPGTTFIALGPGAHPGQMPFGAIIGVCEGRFATRLVDARLQMKAQDVGPAAPGQPHRLIGRLEFDVDGSADERLTFWVDADDPDAAPVSVIRYDLADVALDHLAIDAWELGAERATILRDVRIGRTFDAVASPVRGDASSESITPDTTPR